MRYGRTVIFHIDVNSALSFLGSRLPPPPLGGKEDLRNMVSAVGGDMAMRHGIILAKSIPAKKYQIKTGETIVEARQKCPGLLLVPPNYGLYEKCSKAFMDILRQYSPAVEQYSIDEAFVDMTGTEGLWGDPLTAAVKMKDQIRDTLGLRSISGSLRTSCWRRWHQISRNRIGCIPFGGKNSGIRCGRFRSATCSL